MTVTVTVNKSETRVERGKREWVGEGNRIIRVLENGEPLGKVNRGVRRGTLIKR